MLKQIFTTINPGGFYENFSSHLTSVEINKNKRHFTRIPEHISASIPV